MAMPPAFENQIFEKLPKAFLPPPGPRNGIFFDYGTPTEEVDLYIKHRSLRVTPELMEETKDWHYDDDDVQAAVKMVNVDLRFDPIITCLCARIDALRKLRAADSELEDLGDCLFALLTQHKEFSPYFPLQSIEHFTECVAQSQAEAVTYAVGAVMEQIAAVSKN